MACLRERGARPSGCSANAIARQRPSRRTFGKTPPRRRPGAPGRVLLLGKGAVLAHRVARPLAAESDEYEQRPARDGGEIPAAPLISGVSTGRELPPTWATDRRLR